MTGAVESGGARDGERRLPRGPVATAASLAMTIAATLVLSIVPAEGHLPSAADAYRWVDPPSGIAPTSPAEARRAQVPAEVFAAGRADVWTPDLQAIVALGATATGGGAAHVSLSPIAPARLPALPASLVPNGNAYRVEVSTPGWRPAGVELRLATPFPAASMWSLEGGRWIELDGSTGPDRVSAPVGGTGVFLAGAVRTDGHDSWWARISHDPLRPALLTAALMSALLGGRRRRSAHPPRARRGGQLVTIRLDWPPASS
ncbi:MAG: hypothetical protein KY469_11520 [Actinobacteria bacterium]|nr:hypothetical protein [Actinomycetota bacterium]